MTKITSFSPANLKQVRADIEKALDEVAKKYGLEEIGIGKITYSQNDFRVRMTAKTKAAAVKEDNNLKMMLEQAGIGTTESKTIKITGYNAKCWKNPISFESKVTIRGTGLVKGKPYKASVDSVKSLIALHG